MSVIPENIIEEVRRRADIVEVIAGYLPLKKSGQNYQTLCPFHNEKSPSFNVSPARQMFHCFGCGEGGNVFSFVMKRENITFPEAVRLLANRYGVEISSTERKRDEGLEHLYDAMEAACLFYHENLLKAPPSSPIGRYLEKRELTPDIITLFRLGWAPDEWDALYRGLTAKGFGEKVLDRAGLIKKSSKDNYIDRFRGRLMFPIAAPGGKVTGFGGRIIGESVEGTAKYINSPETPIYKKSRELFGIHLAQQAARREGYVIVAEGYMDAIAIRKAGIENCVAISGTAFTPGHAELVKRMCEKIVIIFDSDTAGITAAKRSGPILIEYGLKVRALTLKDYKDPDEFIAAKGAKEFLEVVSKAPTFHEFLINSALGGRDLSDIDGKTDAIRDILPLIKKIDNEIERSHYIRLIAERAGVDEVSVRRQMIKSGSGSPAPVPAVSASTPRAKKRSGAAERLLLAVLLAHPEYLETVAGDLVATDFSDPENAAVFGVIKTSFLRGMTSAAEIAGAPEAEPVRNVLTLLTMDKTLMFEEESAETTVTDCIHKMRFGPEQRKSLLKGVITAIEERDVEKTDEAQKNYLKSRKKELY